MPKFQITFEDGSTRDVEAANPNDAKHRARNESVRETGAAARNDARVKIASIVNLDEQAGPTDPRNARGGGNRERQGGY